MKFLFSFSKERNFAKNERTEYVVIHSGICATYNDRNKQETNKWETISIFVFPLPFLAQKTLNAVILSFLSSYILSFFLSFFFLVFAFLSFFYLFNRILQYLLNLLFFAPKKKIDYNCLYCIEYKI